MLADVLTAVVIMSTIALLIGVAIWLAGDRLPQNPESPVERVNALLPQTQCAQCGFPGCRPYAEAIVDGRADIDRCAPGGDATVAALASLLGRSAGSVNPEYGQYEPAVVAVIDEDACIGCALCIAACPVDAILGAHRYTHTVIRSECTGCKLCLPPCPVDCIRIESLHRQRAA